MRTPRIATLATIILFGLFGIWSQWAVTFRQFMLLEDSGNFTEELLQQATAWNETQLTIIALNGALILIAFVFLIVAITRRKSPPITTQ